MNRLEERLRIEPDSTIVVLSGKVEYGQGIRDAFARLVAEELGVQPERVRVVLGDTAQVPWDMGTFGSLSVRTDGMLLARAAAVARGQLVKRAAQLWGVDPMTLRVADGEVCAADGRRTSYSALAQPPLSGEIPDDLPLVPPERRRILAGRMERRGARALVTGATRFIADLRPPGLLFGQRLHPPLQGARLGPVSDAAARMIPGVVAVVHNGAFLGVVAERPDQVRAAVAALEPRWESPAEAAEAPTRHVSLCRDSGVAAALSGPASVFEAMYEVPHVANASIGTCAGLADVGPDHAIVHAATQRPFGLREEAAALLGLPQERVRVIAERAAGSYGRNNAGDAGLEAARLSQAVGRPVLVVWSRADEFAASPSRPPLRARVRASLTGDGRIAAWASDVTTSPHAYGGTSFELPDAVVAMTSGRNAVPPYRIPALEVDLHVVRPAIRSGALRSLAAAPNVFAIESAMDELARLAGRDPLDFRLRHIDDPRLRRVLERVAERTDWSRRRGDGGRGLGLACAIYNGTYVAEVAEVAVGRSGEVEFLRAWCAVDCGTVVDPDGARNQIEGGIVQGASWALFEELHHQGGRVTATSWADYPIVTLANAPREIEVVFTDDGRLAPTGLGEPGAVPIGAALANAVAAATGERVRLLPLRPDRVRGSV